MPTPTNIKDQLIRDEGLSLLPYVDTTSHITIGVGRNLTGIGITYSEAMTLLDNDIARADGQLKASCPWTAQLDPARYAVLLAMTFNLGITGLLQFRNMMTAVQAGQWELAAHEMLESKWAQQVGQRAQRLAEQIQSGVWQ